MGQGRSKYQVYKESMMAQRVADKYKEFTEYAGSDTKTSLMIARLNVLAEFGLIDLETPSIKLAKALLNEKRKAAFATSEKVNEISKLGFMLPKRISEVDFDAKTG